MTPPGMVTCINTDINTYNLQRLKKLPTNKKIARNKGGTLFAQREFGLNTETGLLFRKKPKILLFGFKLYLFQKLFLQKAVSPQTSPVKNYWQLDEVDKQGMF